MSGVDRAALIEAAAEATGNICCDEHAIRDAEAVIDAVLPLVAQAIEDAKPRDTIGLFTLVRAAYSDAADVVRSLAEEGQQQ